MGEGILLHLLDFQRHIDEPEVPMEVTQAGISVKLGVRRSHISTSLDSAKSKGLAIEKTLHIRGEKRRRKSYFLTDEGTAAARSLKEEMLAEKIHGQLPDGTHFEGPISEYMEKAGIKELARLVLQVEGGHLKAPVQESGDEPRTYRSDIPEVEEFCGRDVELDSISQFIHSSEKVLVVSGMPGIGKTTLLAKCFGELMPQPFWFSVSEWSSLRNLLKHLADYLAIHNLGRMKTYLDARVQPDLGDIRDILVDIDQPVLLVFDDVQNSSMNLQMFFKMLAHTAGGHNTLKIIMAGRRIPDVIDYRQHLADSKIRKIKLSGLDDEASAKVLADAEIGEERLLQIIERSDGHPLYLALVRGIDAVPENIESMIAHEALQNLSEAEMDMLRSMSIFRGPVPATAVVSEHRDFRVLDTLVSKSLVIRSGGLQTHSLLQDYICERQGKEGLKHNHEAAAEFFGSLAPSPENAIERTFHLIMADDYESAIIIMSESGQSWIKRGYQEELLDLVGIFDESALDNEDIYHIRFLKGAALQQTGDWLAAEKLFSDCLGLAEKLDSDAFAARALNSLGVIQYRMGNFPRAIELFTDARARVDEGDTISAEIANALGVVHWRTGNKAESKQFYELDLRLSEAQDNPGGRARALNNLGILACESGDYDSALQNYALAVNVARELGDDKLVAIVYSNIADSYKIRGDGAEALRYYKKCLAIAEKLGFKWQVAEVYRSMADLVPEKRAEYLKNALDTFVLLGAKEDVKSVEALLAK